MPKITFEKYMQYREERKPLGQLNGLDLNKAVEVHAEHTRQKQMYFHELIIHSFDHSKALHSPSDCN